MSNSLKHLIILGAGASHDFSHPSNRGDNPIFPLTNDLVKGRYTPIEFTSRYKAVRTLFSKMVACVPKKSFEECLQSCKDQEQLDALRLYLGDYFWHLSNAPIVTEQSTNNFLALIDYLKKTPNKGGYVVTFNYDVLFENELGINRLVEMNDYINGSIDNIKLIKMHGSCDWFYIIRKKGLPAKGMSSDTDLGGGRYRVSSYPIGNEDVYTYITRYLIVDWSSYTIHTKRILDGTKESSDFHRIPAIAIPMTGPKSHICPPNHIQVLKDGLNHIEKILVIGWKAGDISLLEILKGLTKPTSLTVVSRTKEGAQYVVDIMQKYIPTIQSAELFVGFSNFVGGSPECEAFFQ